MMNFVVIYYYGSHHGSSYEIEKKSKDLINRTTTCRNRIPPKQTSGWHKPIPYGRLESVTMIIIPTW